MSQNSIPPTQPTKNNNARFHITSNVKIVFPEKIEKTLRRSIGAIETTPPATAQLMSLFLWINAPDIGRPIETKNK
jgi:hypothetical protein